MTRSPSPALPAPRLGPGRRFRPGPRSARDEGVSAVEFGLILPVLMMILMGIIDYGYIFFQYLTMNNAVREGARVGITQQLEGQATDLAENAVDAYLDAANLSVTDYNAAMDANFNLVVTATISPFTPLVGFLPEAAYPSSLEVKSSMRWEYAPP